MGRQPWLARLGVVLGYAGIALAFAWPLPLLLGTHLTGDPTGDSGVYVWNQWVFRHELASGHNPFTTDRLLSLSGRVDLSQHNYTAFLNVLAFPLIPLIGVVASFNVVLLIAMVVTALCAYALARLAFPVTRLEAFIAGLAFAWSPALVARTTGHYSLVVGAPLAAFSYLLIRAHRTQSAGIAAMAGLALAWAAYCDPYFAVFCVLMAGLYVLAELVQVSRWERAGGSRWIRLLDLVLLVAGVAVFVLVLGGGGRIDLGIAAVSVRGLYTPVLILTLLVLLRVAVMFRVRLVEPARHQWVFRFVLSAGLAGSAALAPVLYGLASRIVDGRFVNPPIQWRSSARGVDLLAFFEPNPNHVVSRWLLGEERAAAMAWSPEYIAALSLVALAVVAFAVLAARFRPAQYWPWLTIGFMTLALGPFVIVGGLNTHVPTLWALLRYVPVINFARTPTRFAIVAALGLAMLLAGALAAIGRRWPGRRHAIGWMVCLALAMELCPAPRRLFPATYSSLSDIIAADPRPVRVLNLPFGVRDGVSSAGNFAARSQFEQTRHQKPLFGGYLSRVSRRRLTMTQRDFPVLASLMRMSEGRPPEPGEAERLLAEGPGFVAQSSLGYVVIDHAQASPQLTALAIDAFRLELIERDGVFALYRPRE
ncbi:MAG: hypothetical protein IT177_18780 [Acidobacteria bacterium]|nr:hypothetical protein [Acidobacteriota bacterium]